MSQNFSQTASKRVALVTGATGFVGKRLCSALVDEGYQIRIYSNHSYSDFDSLLVSESNWHQGSLLDKSQLAVACEGVDLVFHLAGSAHSRNIQADQINQDIIGSQNIYLVSRSAGAKKFVFVSSILASNSAPNSYAWGKYSVEQFLISNEKLDPMTKVIVLRPANVYGPNMKGILPIFIKAASRKLLPGLPDLSSKFQMVSVDDLCRVALDVSSRPNSVLASPSVFVVSDGQQYSPNRIESAVYEGLGQKPPRFKSSRALIFLAAIFGHILNYTGIKKNQLGLHFYHNIVSGRQASAVSSIRHYDFSPTHTLESAMPEIIASLKGN